MRINEVEHTHPYKPKEKTDDIEYRAIGTKDEIQKILAVLSGTKSTKYTKLGRDLVRIKQLTEELDTLKKQTNSEVKSLIEGLFKAEDAVYQRVVETVGFLFVLSKAPKSSESIKWKEIVDELVTMMPELVEVIEKLKKTHTTIGAAKSPSLRTYDKAVDKVELEESINENRVRDLSNQVYRATMSWAHSWDKKFSDLKKSIDQSF